MMEVKKYLEMVSYVGKSDIPEDDANSYYSKFDNSYMTRVGMEDNVRFLAEREITKELQHGVGYSEKTCEWFGWSHRAIFGFKVGSTCKKGDCHYVGSSLKEQEDAALEFWDDDVHSKTWCNGIIEDGDKRRFDIQWQYNQKVSNKKLKGTQGGCHHLITPLGKGEWIAETMEDAKKMAIDFNEGVS